MDSKRIVKIIAATILGVGLAAGTAIPAAVAADGSGSNAARVRDTGWG